MRFGALAPSSHLRTGALARWRHRLSSVLARWRHHVDLFGSLAPSHLARAACREWPASAIGRADAVEVTPGAAPDASEAGVHTGDYGTDDVTGYARISLLLASNSG